MEKFYVSDFAACQAGVSRIHAELGPIGILVNNAGIPRDSTLARVSREM